MHGIEALGSGDPTPDCGSASAEVVGDALQPLSLRVNSSTRAELQRQAVAAGLPLSLYCRRLLEAAADQPCA